MNEFSQDSRLNSVLDEFSQDSRLYSVSDEFPQDSRLYSTLDEFPQDSGLNIRNRLSPLSSSCVQNKFIVEYYFTGSPDLSVFAAGKSDTPVISHTPKEDNLVHCFSSSSHSAHSNVFCSPEFFSSIVDPSFQSFSPSAFIPLQTFVSLHHHVHAVGLPNFRGARLAVPTSLNLPLWHSLLSEYSDACVCDFLEFGWPIGYNYNGVFSSSEFRNHKGALDFPSAVDSYLSSELELGSVCIPFAGNPFSVPIAVSSLNSVPKQGSD